MTTNLSRLWARQWGNPKNRRRLLTLTSGLLIVLALAAGRVSLPSGLVDGLMIAAALIAGGDIAARAFASLRNRYVSIELLVTVAAGGALIIGEYWEAAAVTFLFMLGAYLEARTLSQTRQVLQSLLEVAPTTAIVLRDGEQQEVAPYEVLAGETVLVKPGAKVPVDGDVTDGLSAVDESVITGEPFPEEKSAGASVFAGTINLDGWLHVRATGVGADTTLARIIHRVEEAQEEKAPTQRFIERFARWYTPFIMVLSGVVLLLTRDVAFALTILVIGCPGALVISTPISVVAGIGRAAKRGILMKGGEYLENAGKISALALDKTGTLTQGKPRVTDVLVLSPVPAPALAGAIADVPRSDRWSAEQQDVLFWAGIAETNSEHPLARSIMAEAATVGPLPAPDDFATFTGRGVRADALGRRVAVGTAAFFAEQDIDVTPQASHALAELSGGGKTAVLVAVDGVLAGVIGIADTLRETAPQVIRELRDAGVRRIVMLTGDDRATAEAIAAEAGIDEVHAGLLPEDKLDIVRQLQREGHVVAMVGDGINDGPALAAADIGIAMGAGGTDVAIETADIALIADDLRKLPEAVRLSRATLRNIRQNVLIALVVVAALLAGVLLRQVHMAGGMLIHELSVLVVVLNGMRLMRV